MTDKFDIIETVSNTIINRLENFSGEWEKPFISSFARNITTKKAYRGINILILNFAALFNGFSSSVWGTYRQWQEKGYQVKKGSKATTIVFWKPLSYKCEVENTETGDIEEPLSENDNGLSFSSARSDICRRAKAIKSPVASLKNICENQAFVARAYAVFNGSQVEGFTAENERGDFSIQADVMKFFDNTDIAYFYSANLTGYDSRRDVVLMPARNDFKTETGFISTLAHETIHATGHKSRLNRDMKGRFGNESYAFEELIADIGAGFVAGYLGYDYQFSKNNLAYLKSWLKVLKNDKKAIFKACSEAQKAFDYLLTFQEIGREAA